MKLQLHHHRIAEGPILQATASQDLPLYHLTMEEVRVVILAKEEAAAVEAVAVPTVQPAPAHSLPTPDLLLQEAAVVLQANTEDLPAAVVQDQVQDILQAVLPVVLLLHILLAQEAAAAAHRVEVIHRQAQDQALVLQDQVRLQGDDKVNKALSSFYKYIQTF